MNGDRLGNALDKWWVKAEQKQFLYGTVGRVNPDNTVTIVVPQRPDFVYVVMTDSTLAQARNQRRVPLRSGLPVKMRRENGTLVILEEDRTGLLENDPNAPGTVYSVNGQTGDVLLDFIDLTDVPTAYTGHANKVVAVKVAEDGLEFITNASDVAAAIVAAADKATPVDADLLALVDSAASFVLKQLTWANLKATLKVYLDTLYGLLGTANTWVQNQTIASTQTTGNALRVIRDLTATSTDAPVVDIVQDHAGDDQAAVRVQQDGTGAIAELYDGATLVLRVNDGGRLDVAQIMRALSASGLRLEDAAGNLGVFVEDGGQVGINTITPAAALDVVGTMAGDTNMIITRATGTATIRATGSATTGIGSMQASSDAVDLRFQAYGSAVAGTRGGQAFASAGEFVVATGNKFLITVLPNAPLHFLTNTIVRMTILGDGKVGIGTTAPGKELTVTGDAEISGEMAAGWLESSSWQSLGFGHHFYSDGGSPELMVLGENGRLGINHGVPSAMLQVEQTSLTGAIPTLRLRQADLSEEFIRFEATVAAGNPINTTALGTYYGRARVHVDGVGEKWIALYNT